MPSIQYNGGGTFITIIGGKFKQKSEEGVAGATLREYELKDGTKGSKWELSYDGWCGTLKDLAFEDTKFGKVINLNFEDVTVQVSKQSRYFASLLEKLPNIDLKKEFTITPYSFEADGKKRTGVSISQDNEKIKGAFFDGKNTLLGAPDGKDVDWKDEDECKMFFMTRDKFLIGYIQENVIDKFEKVLGSSDVPFDLTDVDEDLNDISFD